MLVHRKRLLATRCSVLWRSTGLVILGLIVSASAALLGVRPTQARQPGDEPVKLNREDASAVPHKDRGDSLSKVDGGESGTGQTETGPKTPKSIDFRDGEREYQFRQGMVTARARQTAKLLWQTSLDRREAPDQVKVPTGFSLILLFWNDGTAVALDGRTGQLRKLGKVFALAGAVESEEFGEKRRVAKELLRYDGKTFSEWQRDLRTELKPERRAEALAGRREKSGLWICAGEFFAAAFLELGFIVEGIDL